MFSRQQLIERMPALSEEDCERAFFQAKWPDGFCCPRCSCGEYYPISSRNRRLFECRSCAHQTSLTVGTILEGTRTPMVKWFQALYLMQTGISATLLAELIHVTYKTAWLINHKLRHAIQTRDEGRPLKGDLQLYGDFYSAPVVSRFFDPLDRRDQPAVVGASMDVETGEIAEVKIKRADATLFERRVFGTESFGGFLWRHVSDTKSGVRRIEIVKRADYSGVTALGAVWRDAVRWLARTFGGIGPKHLQAYLDEYCFRINVRENPLETLLLECGATATVTLRELVGKKRTVQAIRWTGLTVQKSKGRRSMTAC